MKRDIMKTNFSGTEESTEEIIVRKIIEVAVDDWKRESRKLMRAISSKKRIEAYIEIEKIERWFRSDDYYAMSPVAGEEMIRLIREHYAPEGFDEAMENANKLYWNSVYHKSYSVDNARNKFEERRKNK